MQQGERADSGSQLEGAAHTEAAVTSHSQPRVRVIHTDTHFPASTYRVAAKRMVPPTMGKSS